MDSHLVVIGNGGWGVPPKGYRQSSRDAQGVKSTKDMLTPEREHRNAILFA
jgi:hypothetical protein